MKVHWSAFIYFFVPLYNVNVFTVTFNIACLLNKIIIFLNGSVLMISIKKYEAAHFFFMFF